MDIDDSSSSSDNEANPGDADFHKSSCSKDHGSDEGSSSSSVESSDIVKDMETDEVDKRLGVEGLHQTLSHHCDADISETKASEDTLSKDTVCTDDNEHNTEKHPENLILKNCISESVSDDEPVDLDRYDSKEELANLGLERLKNALMTRGLKCGGTLEERAERLFSVKGLSPDEIDPSLFAKSKGKGKKSKGITV